MNELTMQLKNKEVVETLVHKRGLMVKSTIHDKTNNCLYTAGLKRYKDVSLYTSKGYQTFEEFIFSTIKVEGTFGIQEFIVGTAMRDSYEIINSIVAEKIHFEDLGSYIESRINFNDIDKRTEHILEELEK